MEATFRAHKIRPPRPNCEGSKQIDQGGVRTLVMTRTIRHERPTLPGRALFLLGGGDLTYPRWVESSLGV